MDFSFNCPFCNQALTIDESGVGAELACPKCGEVLIIPAPDHPGGPVTEGDQPTHTISLPTSSRVEAQIMKPSKPLDVAAKSLKKIRLKTFRHHELVKDGKDTFDDAVSDFLAKTGEDNIVGVHTVHYSHTPKDATAPVSDYGITVVYKT
ncbi:MAG: hypothetical protein HY300_06720 [Verrucomicrobia bacterium]|nr:hypothetical protein [Verrucomicrobiota bacterium]